MAKIELPQAKADLVQLVKKRKLIPMVGAGASADSGLPTWGDLIQRFIAMIRSLPLTPEQTRALGSELNRLLNDSVEHTKRDPLRTASVLKTRLKKIFPGTRAGASSQTRTLAETKYDLWLSETFANKKPNIKHKSIVGTNFPYILTTNYDILLEDAAVDCGFQELASKIYTFKSATQLADAVLSRRNCIIHIHGYYGDLLLDELVFTHDDYRRLIKQRYEGFSFVLRMLFFQYSTLYIGYGASDPHLEDVVQDLSAYFPDEGDRSAGGHQSYLLLKRDKIDEVLIEYKGRLKTNLVPIDNYSEVDELLEDLRKAAPRKAN